MDRVISKDLFQGPSRVRKLTEVIPVPTQEFDQIKKMKHAAMSEHFLREGEARQSLVQRFADFPESELIVGHAATLLHGAGSNGRLHCGQIGI